MKDKITLEEFWKSEEDLAIHCKTEEQAIKLCKAFDKMGKKWRSGERYIDDNCWGECEENTCYDNDNNDNGYCHVNFYKTYNYKIYEFEDVILEDKQELITSNQEYLKEKRIKVLETIKPICKAFKIIDYDYIVDGKIYRETLKLNNTYIGCTMNSIEATVNEILKYLVIKRNISLGAFQNQTTHYLTRHWRKDE